MANDASYVPLGRDNTGAATVLRPFDSEAIWNAYDRANAPVKKPILDSYGKDIRELKTTVHPKHASEVNSKVAEFIKKQTEIAARASAEKRDINEAEQIELHDLRSDINNTISFSKQRMQLAKEAQNKINTNPYLYDADVKEKLRKWEDMPLSEALNSNNVFFDLKPIPKDNITPWLKSKGTPWKKSTGRTVNADGSASGGSGYTFNEPLARENFRNNIAGDLDSEEGRKWIAMNKDAAQRVAATQNMNFDELSQEDQAEIVMQTLEDDYVQTMKSLMPRDASGYNKAAPIKDGVGQGKNAVTVDDIKIKQEGRFMPFNKSGRVVQGTETDKGFTANYNDGGYVEYMQSATVPIAGLFGRKIPMDNAVMNFEKEDGGFIVGRPVDIKVYRNPITKKVDYKLVVVGDKDGIKNEVDWDRNAEKITERFNTDFIKLINEKNPDLEAELAAQAPPPIKKLKAFVDGNKVVKDNLIKAYLRSEFDVPDDLLEEFGLKAKTTTKPKKKEKKENKYDKYKRNQ